MKKILYPLFFLFILIMPMFADQMKNDAQTVRITDKDGKLFSWLHRGELFFQSYGRLKEGEYIYRGSNGKLVVVSNNLQEFSNMLHEELSDTVHVNSFIQSPLPEAVLSFMEPSHSYVINNETVKSQESLPSYTWGNMSDQKKIQRSIDILKKYVSIGKLVIENNKWNREFYIALQNGSVEKWSLDGNLSPFSIDHLKKTLIEKEGTVVPRPEVGNTFQLK